MSGSITLSKYHTARSKERMIGPKLRRCPKGSRRNRKTMICQQRVRRLTYKSPSAKTRRTFGPNRKMFGPRMKNCPTGFERNELTGLCENKGVYGPRLKRCRTGFTRSKATGLCQKRYM